MSLKTPTKASQNAAAKVFEDESKPALTLDELRQRFVGDVELPEGTPKSTRLNVFPDLAHVLSDQEPLLMETKRRFVLFPIQYPEVLHIMPLLVIH